MTTAGEVARERARAAAIEQLSEMRSLLRDFTGQVTTLAGFDNGIYLRNCLDSAWRSVGYALDAIPPPSGEQ
jgi:hypothetical protein